MEKQMNQFEPLDIFTVSESLCDYLGRLIEGIIKTIEAYRNEKYQEGRENLPPMAEGLDWCFEALIQTAPVFEKYGHAIDVDQLHNLATQLYHALKSKDVIHIPDTLEYEFLPFLVQKHIFLTSCLMMNRTERHALTENMDALTQRFPELVELMEATDENSESEEVVEIDPARDAGNTLRISKGNGSGLYTNSSYNPVIEADRWVSVATENGAKSVVVFGMALGQRLRSLLELTTDVEIIVYEPSIAIFAEVMRRVPLADVLDDERLSLAVGDITPLAPMLQSLTPRMTHMAIMPNYDQLFPEACEEWAHTIGLNAREAAS
jgi:hypothetical protein